ncbi:hypothetical protein Nepgr_032201 [Nepenthes gracilis]|uniref:Uncharacterized protein n=1 Tax=Nepenthes gracilis TaxID=150966 RepID=A0AAD3Y5V7_NEPGR|nr:hypothetical protein Nepgr_032201 [Nepenthes gracilis]
MRAEIYVYVCVDMSEFSSGVSVVAVRPIVTAVAMVGVFACAMSGIMSEATAVTLFDVAATLVWATMTALIHRCSCFVGYGPSLIFNTTVEGNPHIPSSRGVSKAVDVLDTPGCHPFHSEVSSECATWPLICEIKPIFNRREISSGPDLDVVSASGVQIMVPNVTHFEGDPLSAGSGSPSSLQIPAPALVRCGLCRKLGHDASKCSSKLAYRPTRYIYSLLSAPPDLAVPMDIKLTGITQSNVVKDPVVQTSNSFDVLQLGDENGPSLDVSGAVSTEAYLVCESGMKKVPSLKPAAEEGEFESGFKQNSSYSVMSPTVLPSAETHESRTDHMSLSEPSAVRDSVLQYNIASSKMQVEVSLRAVVSSEDAIIDLRGSSCHGEVVGSPDVCPAPTALGVFLVLDMHDTPAQINPPETVSPFLVMAIEHHGDHNVDAPTMEQPPSFDDVVSKVARIEAWIAAREAAPNSAIKIATKVERLRRKLAELKANRSLVLTPSVGSGTSDDFNDPQCHSLDTSNVLEVSRFVQSPFSVEGMSPTTEGGGSLSCLKKPKRRKKKCYPSDILHAMVTDLARSTMAEGWPERTGKRTTLRFRGCGLLEKWNGEMLDKRQIKRFSS